MDVFSRVRNTGWFRLLAMASAVCMILVVAQSYTSATPQPSVDAIPALADTLDLSKIYGKIQIVEDFPDYKVQVVESFPDLKVQVVEHFPDSEGKWQFVEHFPDFKIQFVDHFPDFKIQYVDHFPGIQ